VSELRNRLEALATRGTRRGADAVLNAAQRDAQVNEADASDADAVEMSFPDDDAGIRARA
jgi:hypothetical protein